MVYLESPRLDPRWNLALEQYIFEHLDRAHDYLMLWQNDNTIVVGKNQNAAAEMNHAYVAEKGITVVRRLSGGGTVYHDRGNLNFTLITDKGRLDKIDLHMFCEPVVRTLAAFGVRAEISGRNDITVGGRKFSGNAQYIKDGRVMHHGTILFDSDLSVLQNALKPDPDKIRSKGVKSVSSRVTNLREHLPAGTTLTMFKEELKRQMSAGQELVPYALNEKDLKAVEAIMAERYADREWTFGRVKTYDVNRSRRIENCGTVKVSLRLREGNIDAISFAGDFFGSSDLGELESILTGCGCTKEAVFSILQAADPGLYIHNITAAQLADLITEGI